MKNILTIFILLVQTGIWSQEKKQLEHADFDRWNRIVAPAISENGKWISYELKPGYGDPTLFITDEKGIRILDYHRGTNARFNTENSFLVFMIKPPLDSLNNQRRKKMKEDELLKDTLALFNLSKKKLIKQARVKSYKLPEKWGSHLAFQVYGDPPVKEQKKDTARAEVKSKNAKKGKKESEKNGYNLIVRDLLLNKQDTFPFVKEYIFAEETKKLLFSSTGNDTVFMPGVYLLDLSTGILAHMCRGKGEYKNLSLNKTGTMAAFLTDRDTTKERVRPIELMFWKEGQDSARVLAHNKSSFLTKGRIMSEHFKPYFSENAKFLFFGLAPMPVLQDTLLLPEEIVNVEVWNYKDKRLYTQQNARLKEDLKKSYQIAYLIENETFYQITDEEVENARFSYKSNSEWVLGLSNLPYQDLASWEGSPYHYDVYKINILKSTREQLFKDIRLSSINISPAGKYMFWYNPLDSAWYTHENASGKTLKLIGPRQAMLADELNDVPNFPDPYGYAGWTKNDSLLLVYDRYDFWVLDPKDPGRHQMFSIGRKNQTIYRYLNLYPDEPFIDPAKAQIFKTFNEKTKAEGFSRLDLRKTNISPLLTENFRFQRVIKSEKSEKLILTRENFENFPDLYHSDLNFKKLVRISNANPQQKDYLWGSVQLHKWKSLDGIDMEGLLYKPANFDPSKKYPMIVNFYERSSDGLNRHLIPEPHRSTVNYSFYTSRGYVIFVPDIVYRDGYPGESAFNCVMPGVTSVLSLGFVDEKRIGVQGHSWGAYQIAHILTKTKLFAAAEAGAPVPNMISAYGGIRWETGLNRIFQYEHGQSRIGGSLWEYPLRFIENSPIFNLDKINTPLLLMHNDNDGHVPWYQGIEWFVSMRRLGKPVWMLNYNGEPHWPLKWQNQKDFNIRMQQFFDHYLKGEPMPVWMEKGVPATEKGITSGYELVK